MSITKINLSIKQSVLLRLIKNGESLEDASSKAGLHISELPDSDAGVVPDTFAMRFSRV